MPIPFAGARTGEVPARWLGLGTLCRHPALHVHRPGMVRSPPSLVSAEVDLSSAVGILMLRFQASKWLRVASAATLCLSHGCLSRWDRDTLPSGGGATAASNGWQHPAWTLLRGSRLERAAAAYAPGVKRLVAAVARLRELHAQLQAEGPPQVEAGADVLAGWASSEEAALWARSAVWSRAFSVRRSTGGTGAPGGRLTVCMVPGKGLAGVEGSLLGRSTKSLLSSCPRAAPAAPSAGHDRPPPRRVSGLAHRPRRRERIQLGADGGRPAGTCCLGRGLSS